MNSIIESRDIDGSHPRRRIRMTIINGEYLRFFWAPAGFKSRTLGRFMYSPQMVDAEILFRKRTRVSGYKSPFLLERADVLKHLEFAKKNSRSYHGSSDPQNMV